MKKYLVVCLAIMSSFAHASLYIENGGRVFLEEIECLASEIDKDSIICNQYNEYMLCSALFSARLRTGEMEVLQIQSETIVASDSKLWKKISFGVTDKINAVSAKVEGKFDLKERIKNLEEIRRCDSSDE